MSLSQSNVIYNESIMDSVYQKGSGELTVLIQFFEKTIFKEYN